MNPLLFISILACLDSDGIKTDCQNIPTVISLFEDHYWQVYVYNLFTSLALRKVKWIVHHKKCKCFHLHQSISSAKKIIDIYIYRFLFYFVFILFIQWKSMGCKTKLGLIGFHFTFSTQRILGKKVIQVRNTMRVCKWPNFNFWVNYPFKNYERFHRVFSNPLH